MTTHYIDITLLPDPEFSQAHLMNALVAKLHRALVQLQASDIGVSFPGHVDKPAGMRSLGCCMRLHGQAERLEALMSLSWLKGMRDHTEVSVCAVAPANARHRIVRRRQTKSSAERLRRRRMLRKGETADQAAQAIPSTVERRSSLPFVNLQSSSTDQAFSMFVEHGQLLDAPVPGAFNTYGLSLGGTVPWF